MNSHFEQSKSEYLNDYNRRKSLDERNQPDNKDVISFVWWQFWPWISISIGNILLLELSNQREQNIAIVSIILNTIICIMILRYNKYAFLIGTIISLNPIIWLINGIYLKNRWNHPKVNKKVSSVSNENNITKPLFNKTTKSVDKLWMMPRNEAINEVKYFIEVIKNYDNFKISLNFAAALILRDDLLKSNAYETVKMLDGKNSILSKQEIFDLLLKFRENQKTLKENGKSFYANGYWLWMITIITYLYDLNSERKQIWDIMTNKNNKVYDILNDLELDGEKISIEVKHNPNYRPI